MEYLLLKLIGNQTSHFKQCILEISFQETERQLPTSSFGDLIVGFYFCAFLLKAKSRFFKTSSISIFYLFDLCFMQRAGRVLKSFGVKSYKLLLIIHFLTQHTLNLGFLFVFFLLQFKSRNYFLSCDLIKITGNFLLQSLVKGAFRVPSSPS